MIDLVTERNVARNERNVARMECVRLRRALVRASEAIMYPLHTYAIMRDDYPDTCKHLKAEKYAADESLNIRNV